MDNTTTVSIIMPAYNDERYIAQAIKSVQDQSHAAWELVIINDGSKDTTLQIISDAAAQDKRIVLVNHDYNEGLVSSLNDGLACSQNELIARLDSDDYWVDSEKLSKQIAFLENNPDHALVGTRGLAVSETNDRLFDLVFPETDTAIRQEILRHNCFIHSSVLFRKHVILGLGGYSGNANFTEDYELWLKVGLRHKFAVLKDITVHYRINTQGLTQTRTIARWQSFTALAKLYRKEYPNSLRAYIKLNAQIFYLQLFGPKFLNGLKKIIIGLKNRIRTMLSISVL